MFKKSMEDIKVRRIKEDYEARDLGSGLRNSRTINYLVGPL